VFEWHGFEIMFSSENFQQFQLNLIINMIKDTFDKLIDRQHCYKENLAINGLYTFGLT